MMSDAFFVFSLPTFRFFFFNSRVAHRFASRPKSPRENLYLFVVCRVMAKLGEGDPRWIVSDRPDGTNINGWHWEETNKMKFCKEFFEAHCCRAQPYSEGESVDLFGEKCLKCSILSVSVEGECSISTRKKGKKFGVFDLKVTMVYEVELECVVKKKTKKKKEENVDGLDGEEEEEETEEEKLCAVKGEITLKEFSSLNEPDEYEWTTKTTGGDDEAKKIVKNWFTRPVLEKMFGKTLEKFVEEMNAFCG
jgi:hypothetical protein